MPANDTAATRRRPSGPATRIAAALAAAALAATTAACGQGDLPDTEAANTSSATAEELTETNVDAWLDDMLPAELEQRGIAGATVAVVHDGAIVTARGYGHADTGEGVAVDPEQTLFRPGSVSKLFTATAVMQLVEQGVLELDTDIEQYIDFTLPREFDADITLRHLLTHTAGFEERLHGMIGTGDEPVDLREAMTTDPPEQVYEPGTTPAYSNFGNGLAGYIVERAGGMPFEDYIQRNVLEPIGMTSSTFHQPLPDDLAERMSSAYDLASGPARPFEMISPPPAGSLSATATDMAQFMLAHLGDLPEQYSLLSEETLELMHAPALTEDTLGDLADAPRMTLGFFDESRNGHRVIGHGGDTNYFHSHLQIYPDDGAGIFVSLNSNGHDARGTLELRSALTDAFADRYFPADGDAPEPVDEETMRANAEAVAGTYTSSRGFHSTFLSTVELLQPVEVSALDDGRLLFEPDPGTGSPAVYEQIGDTLWQEVGGQRTVATRVQDGEVTGIVHDGAFTLLPVDTDRRIGLPVLIASAAVLVIGLLAWPIAAIVRRVRRRPAPERDGRLPRILVRVAALGAVLALAGWVFTVLTIMSLQDVPAAAIRTVQVLQLIGVAGIVPAAFVVVRDFRRKAGWRAWVPSVLMLLALSGIMNFAVEFQLLSPNISY
ncbi:serine hydrolase domain-containing protein [Glycomyces tarimensis]